MNHTPNFNILINTFGSESYNLSNKVSINICDIRGKRLLNKLMFISIRIIITHKNFKQAHIILLVEQRKIKPIMGILLAKIEFQYYHYTGMMSIISMLKLVI